MVVSDQGSSLPNEGGIGASKSLKIGLHGLPNPNLLRQTGAGGLRMIVSDTELKQILSGKGGPKAQAAMKMVQQLHSQGAHVVVSLRFPDRDGPESTSSVRPRFDRIPKGQDRTETIQLVRRFLRQAGPFLYGVQLNNEPVGGPGQYAMKDMDPRGNAWSPATQWFIDLVNVIREERASNRRLSNLKIVSPGFAGIGEYLRGKRFPKAYLAFTEELIRFSNEYTELLDVHLHVEDVEQVREIVEYMRKQSSLPFITLEWSQARGVFGWMKERVQVPGYRGTNEDFIRQAYRNPVTPDVWRTFMESSPLDPHFVRESFPILRDAGFVFVCYGPSIQYGDPPFDMVCLFAAKTVKSSGGRVPRNEFWFGQYQKLVR
ncbi:MAG: hypothetical protein ACPGN3_03205 [Opitutales bacterium]